MNKKGGQGCGMKKEKYLVDGGVIVVIVTTEEKTFESKNKFLSIINRTCEVGGAGAMAWVDNRCIRVLGEEGRKKDFSPVLSTFKSNSKSQVEHNLAIKM